MARPTEIFPDFPYSWTEELSGIEPDAGSRTLYVWLSQPGTHTAKLSVDQDTWEVALNPSDVSRMEPGVADLLVMLKEGSANVEKKGSYPIAIRGHARSLEDEHAYKMLAAIEKALESDSRKPWEEDLNVDGETTRFSSLSDMLAARIHYRREVKSLRDKMRVSAGLPSRNRILSKF